jgi:hypothetical protein
LLKEAVAVAVEVEAAQEGPAGAALPVLKVDRDRVGAGRVPTRRKDPVVVSRVLALSKMVITISRRTMSRPHWLA